MKLGIAGIIPGDFSIDDNWGRKVAELGFSGVVCHWTGTAEGLTPAIMANVQAVFSRFKLTNIQLWGVYPTLIAGEEERAAAVAYQKVMIEKAAQMGAQSVGLRPTSLNPRGVWWPHPENHSQRSEDRLVAALEQLVPHCEKYNVPLALECHVTTVLDSPERVRRIIERVSPEWIKVNFDVVNFVADFPTAYNTTALINRMFDVLGPYIFSTHLKDVYVEDRHTVHISETVPGQGILDFDTLFRRLEAEVPHLYAAIEHLPESLVPQAAAFVKGKLAALGIPITA
jgi:sugar phosphate isomerase/epimerase